MKDWLECAHCAEEFKVVVLCETEVLFCPCCGSELEHDEPEEDEDIGYEE